MARHRGTFKPEHPEPYEISRSQIESFRRCPACFWMNRVKGIKFPGIPPFLLNTATDTLLKKDFDVYRHSQTPHPFMEKHDLEHLVPFQHADFETWTKALQLGFQTYHEESNLIIGGGLDDVWHNREEDLLHIVDYKSTASKRNEDLTALQTIKLEGHYKDSYKRQMDIYQWIMRHNDFNVSNTAYFVYVNGDQHFESGMLDDNGEQATMKFVVQLIEYEGDDSWVENTILDIKECLYQEHCPEHSNSGFGPKGNKQCEYAELFDGMGRNGLKR